MKRAIELLATASFVLLLLQAPVLLPQTPVISRAAQPTSNSAGASPYTEYQLPTNASEPLGIAVDGRGTVWFAESTTMSLVAFYPSNSSFTSYHIPYSATTCEVWGVAVAPDGNIWFGDSVSNAIWEFQVASSSFKSFPIPTAASYPFALAFGKDGMLYFTELYGGKIGRLDPQTGQIKEFQVPTKNAGPAGFDFDSNGNLWFAEQYAGQLGEFNPTTGSFSEYRLTSWSIVPRGVVVDDTGRIWMTDSNSSSIILFNPATKSVSVFSTIDADYPLGVASPYLLRKGPDGSIWFNERAGNRIAKINPSTMQMIEFQVPYLLSGLTSLGAEPTCCTTPAATGSPIFPVELLSMATDSNGNLWFTEFSNNTIGVIYSNYQSPFSLSVSLPATIPKNSNISISVTVHSNLLSQNNTWMGSVMPESENLAVSHSYINPVILDPNSSITEGFSVAIPASSSSGVYTFAIYVEGFPSQTLIVSSLVTINTGGSSETQNSVQTTTSSLPSSTTTSSLPSSTTTSSLPSSTTTSTTPISLQPQLIGLLVLVVVLVAAAFLVIRRRRSS